MCLSCLLSCLASKHVFGIFDDVALFGPIDAFGMKMQQVCPLHKFHCYHDWQFPEVLLFGIGVILSNATSMFWALAWTYLPFLRGMWTGEGKADGCTCRDRVRNNRIVLTKLRSSLRFELFREVAFGSLAQSVPLLLWRWMRASCFGLRPCYRSFWRQNVLNMTITLAKPIHDSNQGL